MERSAAVTVGWACSKGVCSRSIHLIRCLLDRSTAQQKGAAGQNCSPSTAAGAELQEVQAAGSENGLRQLT